MEKEPVSSIVASKDKLKVILDTNVIFAYLNPKDEHHFEAESVVSGFITKKTYFFIPHIILGEFIAHKDRINGKKISIRKALNFFDKFTSKLQFLSGGPGIDSQRILKAYRKHSRHRKVVECGFSDFMILTMGEEIENIRIITCDKKMCKLGKTIFKDRIYYLPNNSKDFKSDYPRLMSELQNNFQ